MEIYLQVYPQAQFNSASIVLACVLTYSNLYGRPSGGGRTLRQRICGSRELSDTSTVA